MGIWRGRRAGGDTAGWTRPGMKSLTLIQQPGTLAVCRLPASADLSGLTAGLARTGRPVSITQTGTETSIVCPVEAAPAGAEVEPGWTALVVAGRLDFSLTGILAGLAGPLAQAGISLFALSTFETDWLLVKEADLAAAAAALTEAGHTVIPTGPEPARQSRI